MIVRFRLMWILGIVVASLPGFGHADTVTLSALNAGFVTELGGSAKGDGTLATPATFNYSVGQAEHFDDGSLSGGLTFTLRKNYFIFDLAGVTDPITSAKFTVYMGPDTPPAFPGGEHGYESLDPFEDYALLETIGSGAAIGIISDLLTGNLTVGPTAFDEPTDPLVLAAKDLYGILGDGFPLGTITTTSADDDTFLEIDFTPIGVDYLNLFLGGPVVLSGELTTVGAADTTELIFGFTGPDIIGGSDPSFVPTLTVTTIPEPGSLGFLAACLFALSCRRRQRAMEKG